MDRSEPTLAPQWLKASGSSSNSDEHNTGTTRNRLPLSVCDNDSPRASSPSISFIRSVSNSTTGQDNANYSNSRVYSNFGRRRDRDRDKDKDRNKDRWEKDSLLDNGYTDRRSNVMGSTGRVELLPKRLGSSPNNTNQSPRTSSGYSKVSFEKEFPTLGVEVKQRGSEIARVFSPGISATLSSLHLSSSSLIGGDGWTSALAEVPAVSAGNGTPASPALQTAMHISSSSSNFSTGLSMAKTLAQAPLKSHTSSQSSGDDERYKELALKQQYTKLIPVINSSEKSKLKASKISDVISPKIVAPQPSYHLANQEIRPSPIKPDILKTSLSGKLQVLNREGTFSNNIKNAPTQSSAAGRVTTSSNNPLPIFTANNSKPEGNGIGLDKNKNKNPSSQSQDRKKFFSCLRDQAKMKNGVLYPEEKTNELNIQEKTVLPASNSDMKYCTLTVNGNKDACNGEPEIEALVPDEEEKAFLESLGWNPNTGEDALTAEEIASFVKKHKEKLKPDFTYKACLPDSK